MSKKQAGGVVDFVVHNYQKCKDLAVVLRAGFNGIGGPNGAGKSAVLDAALNIWAGGKLTPVEAIHEGAERFSCSVALKDKGIKLTRQGHYTKAGDQTDELIAESLDTKGATFGQPRRIVDQLLAGSSVTLKPLMEMSRPDRIACLRDLTGVDFAEFDVRKEELLAIIRAKGDHLTALEDRLKGWEKDENPPEPMSVAGLTEELQTRQQCNQQRADQSRAVENAKGAERAATNQLDGLMEQKAALEQRIKEAAKIRAKAERDCASVEQVLAAMPIADEETILDQLRQAEQVNARAKRAQERTAIEAEAAQVRQNITDQRAALKRIEAEKKDLLAEADMPIEGLTFDSNDVQFNGHPLEQASAIEQLEIDVAIALKRNPDIPFLLFYEGGLMDTAHRKKLDDITRDAGVIALVEQVADTAEEAKRLGAVVFMEDGIGTVLDPKARLQAIEKQLDKEAA